MEEKIAELRAKKFEEYKIERIAGIQDKIDTLKDE